MDQSQEYQTNNFIVEQNLQFLQFYNEIVFLTSTQLQKRNSLTILKIIIFPFRINGEIIKIKNNDLKIQLNRFILASNMKLNKGFKLKIHPQIGTLVVQSSCFIYQKQKISQSHQQIYPQYKEYLKNLTNQFKSNKIIRNSFISYLNLIQNDVFTQNKNQKLQQLIKLAYNSNQYSWNALTQDRKSSIQTKQSVKQLEVWSEDEQQQQIYPKKDVNFQLESISFQSNDKETDEIQSNRNEKCQKNVQYSNFYQKKREKYNKMSLIPQKLQMNNFQIEIQDKNLDQMITYFITESEDSFLYQKYLKKYKQKQHQKQNQKNPQYQQKCINRQFPNLNQREYQNNQFCKQFQFQSQTRIIDQQNRQNPDSQYQQNKQDNQFYQGKQNDQELKLQINYKKGIKQKQLPLKNNIKKVIYYQQKVQQSDQQDRFHFQNQLSLKGYLQTNRLTISKSKKWELIIQIIRAIYSDILTKNLNSNNFYIDTGALKISKNYFMKVCIKRTDIFTALSANKEKQKQKQEEQQQIQNSYFEKNQQIQRWQQDFKKQQVQQKKIALLLLRFIIWMIFPNKYLIHGNISPKIKLINKQKFKPQSIDSWIKGVEDKFRETNLLFQSVMLYLYYKSRMSLEGPYADWVVLISQKISEILQCGIVN